MAELAADRARRAAKSRREAMLEEIRMWRNLAALSRFAAPRLPVEVLMCFDSEQRLIRPLPYRRQQVRPVPFIPAQRVAPRGVPSVPRPRRTP